MVTHRDRCSTPRRFRSSPLATAALSLLIAAAAAVAPAAAQDAPKAALMALLPKPPPGWRFLAAPEWWDELDGGSRASAHYVPTKGRGIVVFQYNWHTNSHEVFRQRLADPALARAEGNTALVLSGVRVLEQKSGGSHLLWALPSRHLLIGMHALGVADEEAYRFFGRVPFEKLRRLE